MNNLHQASEDLAHAHHSQQEKQKHLIAQQGQTQEVRFTHKN